MPWRTKSSAGCSPSSCATSFGNRPVFGENALFRRGAAWSEQILFHEYFHGETGEGLGASHQTGWTALVAALVAGRGERMPPPAPSRE